MEASVRRFMITALIGRSTEPVMMNRATIVTTAITRMAQGRCAPMLAFWSTKLAVSPPTRIGYGAGSVRMSSTSCWLALESGGASE